MAYLPPPWSTPSPRTLLISPSFFFMLGIFWGSYFADIYFWWPLLWVACGILYPPINSGVYSLGGRAAGGCRFRARILFSRQNMLAYIYFSRYTYRTCDTIIPLVIIVLYAQRYFFKVTLCIVILQLIWVHERNFPHTRIGDEKPNEVSPTASTK